MKFLIQFVFFVILFLPLHFISANMRAAWNVDRYPSYSLSSHKNGLKILKENLSFECDSLYTGDGDLARILEKKCKVEAVYFISSETDARYLQEFILPSDKEVTIIINESGRQTINPSRFNVDSLDLDRYRLSRICNFCRSEDTNHLFKAEFESNLNKGLNTIQIIYEQPLSLSETKHGYFTTSEWAAGFNYELWPLKEWTQDPEFEINIKYSVNVGSGVERFFRHTIESNCSGRSLGFETYPREPFGKQVGVKDNQNYLLFKEKYFTVEGLRKQGRQYYEKENLVYEFAFQKIFPDRLECFFSPKE